MYIGDLHPVYNCMFVNTLVICTYCHCLSLALKPADLSKVLGNVFEQAKQLKKATESTCASFFHVPNITVSYERFSSFISLSITYSLAASWDLNCSLLVTSHLLFRVTVLVEFTTH